MARRYQNYDTEGDEEIFDEGGILRDGARWRVPMRMMDSMQRDLDQHFAEAESRDSRWARRGAHVTDGRGNCPLSLHRPGPRVLDGGNDSEKVRAARDEAEVAYQQYEAAIQSEWRNIRSTNFGSPGVDPSDNARVQGKIERYLSDLDGGADVDQHVNAFDRRRDGTCERGSRQQDSDPTTLIRDHQRRMAALYAERDRELQDEWRRGK
jgi:hypothetical protein